MVFFISALFSVKDLREASGDHSIEEILSYVGEGVDDAAEEGAYNGAESDAEASDGADNTCDRIINKADHSESKKDNCDNGKEFDHHINNSGQALGLFSRLLSGLSFLILIIHNVSP